MRFEREQFSLELGGFVGIGRSKGCVLGGWCFASYAVHPSRTAMYDAPQLALPFAGVEQDSRALDMGKMIEFCWYAGMIEAAHKMVDGCRTINRPFYLLDIHDTPTNDGDRFTKLRACFLLVASEYLHSLSLF